MPLIPEEDYIRFSKTFVDNQAVMTDEQKTGFATVMQQYRDQQKSLKLPLTPKLDEQTKGERNAAENAIKSLYTGVGNIPISDNVKDIFTTDEDKAELANRKYLSHVYDKGDNYVIDNYDTLKSGFINASKDKGLTDSSNLGMYNFIQKQYKDQDLYNEKVKNSRQYAQEAVNNNKDLTSSLEELDSSDKDKTIDFPEYTDAYNHVSDIINGYKGNIDNFMGAMRNRMTSGESENDNAIINNFHKQLSEMPDEHRDTVLKYVSANAKIQGEEFAKSNTFMNEFADSFGRVFSSGFEGMSNKQLELRLQNINDSGKVVTEIPNIQSSEDAQKYVTEQHSHLLAKDEYSKSAMGGISLPVPEKGTYRELSPTETYLIRQAKDNLQKNINMSREIRNIGQSLDPVRDNWKGYMASATGGSLALLGTAAIPGGIAINQQMYSGSNYDDLRTEYPNMSPANAALIGDVAGTFEAALDQANVSFIKGMPLIKGMFSPGKSVASKLLQGTLAVGGSWAFENAIEGVQDLSKPIAQSILSNLIDNIPSVDWTKEMGNWYENRPKVAIGMIPLALFGATAGSVNKIYNDRSTLKIFSNDDMLQKYGVSEEDRLAIRKMVSDKDADSIRTKWNDIQANRNIAFANAQANRSVNINDVSNIINQNDLIDHATNQTIIPKYVFNSKTNKYDAVINGKAITTGLEKNQIGEHQQNYIKQEIDKSVRQIANIMSDKPLDKTDILSSSQIIDKHNTIAKLNGLDNHSINEINSAFGNSLSQKDIMLKLANDLKDANPAKRSNVLGQYINSVFKNLSSKVQTTLGNNTLEAKANLKNLILNKIGNIVTSNTDNIMFNGMAPNSINISAAQKSAINTLQKNLNDRHIATQLLVSNPNEDFQTTTGISNINSLHKIINQLKSLFGVDVLFFQPSNNAEIGVEGMFDSNSNTIFLNSQNKNPFLFLIGHEFGHFIEKNHPELHKQLKDIILSTMTSEQKDAYYKVLKESSSSYNTDAKLEAELVSDYLGHRMLSEDFLNKLLFKDESLFKTFVTSVKNYITNLKNKIVGKRDISNFITKPMDQIDSFLADLLKQISSNQTVVAVKGEQSFFEDNKENISKQIELLANRMRDTFNSAAHMSQGDVTGLSEEQKKATLDKFITPINDNAFQTAFNEAHGVINTKPLNSYRNALNSHPTSTETLPDGTEVPLPDVTEENAQSLTDSYNETNKAFTEYRKGLHQQAGLLNSAQLTDNYNESVMATALAALNTNKTLDEVNNLNQAEKSDIVKKAASVIDNKLIENYKLNIDNKLDRDKGLIDPKLVYNSKILNIVQKALNSANPLAESTLLLKDLYTENGVPNITKGNFADKLLEYNAYRYLGNTGEKSSNQYQQINKFLETLDVNKPISFFLEDELPGLLKAAQAELSQNDTVINNKTAKNKKVLQETRNFIAKHIQETKRAISSYVDNHLTFASLLEFAFPNQNKTTIDQALVDELNTLSALTNPTQDDLNRIEELKDQVTVGKSLTPTIQKMSDDINNAFLQTHIDNNENENDLLNAVGKGINKTTKDNKNWVISHNKIRQELFRILSLDKGFDISINGENIKLSPAYAAYILNISDQHKYDDKLKEKGFTPDVIKNIKDKLETDYKSVDDLRKELRNLIKKENEKTNDEYTRIYGLAIPTPNANFYPVRYKNRNIAVISPYDTSYQSGTMNKFLDTSIDQVEEELDLNPIEQGDNLISMFHDHMIQSTHKRNLFGPLLVAKQILTDKTISDKLENAFGKSYKELLFTQLAAFETNGIRSNFLDFITTNHVRKMLTNIAKGAMGFKLSTMLVNFTSSLNATMDNSIPAGQIALSYGKVLALGYFSKKNAMFGKDTALASKQIQDRITMGANSLIAISKANSFVNKPSYLREAGNISLAPMNRFDALGGAIAAAAAYDAHYSMAEKSGITDPKILDELATEGMARTINKTFQPVILSGKSSYEMNANPLAKLFTLFMSETRKTLGLELATIKTKGVGSNIRMFITNHLLLGTVSFFLRNIIKSAVNPPTKDDESSWDLSKMWVDVLLGPLSGFLVAGTVLESAVYKLHNLFLDDKDIPVFSKENNIVQAGNQATSVLKLPKDIEEGNAEDFLKDLDYTIKGISTLTGSSTLGGTTTIINVLEQINGLKKAATGKKIITNE